MSFIKKLQDKLGKSKKEPEVPSGVNLAFTSYGGNEKGLNVLPPKPSEGSNFTLSEHRQGKPGGGWADEDENAFSQKKPQPSTQGNTKFNPQPSNGSSQERILESDELEDKNIDYEMKIASDIIQPGGARIKPSNAVLQEFAQNCANLQVSLMASVLMYVLETDIPPVSKAKAFYAVDYLVHNNVKYRKMFEGAIPRIENVEKESQFSGIQDNLISYLKDPTNFSISKEDKVAEVLSKNVDKHSQSNDLLAMGEKKKGFGFIGKKPQEDKSKGGFNFIKAEKEKSQPDTFDLLSHVMSDPHPIGQSNQTQEQIKPAIPPTQDPQVNLLTQTQHNPYSSLYEQPNGYSQPQYQYQFNAQNSLAHKPVEEKKEKDPKEAAFDFISF